MVELSKITTSKIAWLASATAREMSTRGPRPRVVEFADVGHAPMLLSQDQVDPVVEFLLSASARPDTEANV